MTDRQRFEAKITRGPNCWLWTGAITAGARGGYGHLRFGGKVARAHRVAYELYVGPIPDGLWVLHDCDVRRCVNPAHLYVGTHADNMTDRQRRGRTQRHGKGGARGERHPSAKLTDADVIAARVARTNGAGVNELARHYGVDHRSMGRALDGTSWRHI